MMHSGMRSACKTGCALVVVCAILCSAVIAADVAEQKKKTRNWFMTVYGGQMSDSDLLDIMAFDSKFVDAYIAAVTAGKQLWQYDDKFSLEAEGQFVYHWDWEFYCKDPACGNPGWNWAPGFSYRKPNRTEYQELNGVLIFRWLKFPWNRWIDTTFAVGDGISYATREPPIETDYNAKSHGLDYDVSQWLNYMLVELTLGMPALPQWRVFVRIHHRSGVFGLINGVDGGSNAVGFGVRYDFNWLE